MSEFDKWWESDGKFIDPDFSDVPWFDKRESLCESAWNAAQDLARDEIGELTRSLETLCKRGNLVSDRKNAEIRNLQQAIEGLLKHCDADPAGETDFERAVLEARKSLQTVVTN